MKSVLAAFARNTVFSNILTLLILLGGVAAGLTILREFFPQFSLGMITITVPYPGADPEEVENGISRKLEEAISGTEGVRQYNTTAFEGVGTAMIEVHERYDIQTVLDSIRSRVDAIPTLPVGAERPVISELLLRDNVLLIALSGDMSEQRLKTWAREIQQDIQRLSKVSQVFLVGTRDNEISIEISEAQLQRYGLSLEGVASRIRADSLNMAGGTIRASGEHIRIRAVGRRYRGEEFADIVVLAGENGEIVRLGDIATIRDAFDEEPLSSTLDGERAIFVLVSKTPEEDSIAISDQVKAYLAEKQTALPAGARMSVLYDFSETFLAARIRLLTRNGIMGLIIVFLVLWLFLDFRLSFWVGMGMPISMAGAMIVLSAIGATINMISLFGLIMVLGIVVDDAIVVGEAIYVHRKRGEPPLRAAVEGVCEVGMPVIAAVLTTIVAFIPLMYVGGIMGKFIRILPIVVITCLSVSLIESLIMLPAHLSHLPDPNRVQVIRNPIRRFIQWIHKGTSGGMEAFVNRIYVPVLTRSFRWSYALFAASCALFLLIVGVMRGGFVKFEVFPDMDGFIINATVEFPAGTPPEATADAVARLEAAFRRVAERTPTKTGEPLIDYSLTIIGGSLDEAQANQVVVGGRHGGVQVVLLESERRNVHTDVLRKLWEEETGTIPGAKSVIYTGMAAGPPGAPIEIWVQSENMRDILWAAENIEAKLKQFEGVYQIRSDFSPGKRELRLSLKPEAHSLGLTLRDLAQQVSAGYFGAEALRLQRGQEDIRIRVKYPTLERSTQASLAEVRIRTRDGREIPLSAVARIEPTSGLSSITRTDGLRRVTVSADVDTATANTVELLDELNREFFPLLQRERPGLVVKVQGEQQKMRESFSTLAIGFPMALLGIYVIIATMFRSYLQPLIIMFTVPFGIIGAILGHLLLGYQLSMMSLFGIVAMAGVVVNDAIVMIEAVNANMAGGMPFFKALSEGGRRRFRAIFLTTITTVAGLMPMILERDLQARVLVPMAVSIAAGVAFASLLTLLFIPALIVIMNDLRRFVFFVNTGRRPTREQVEPAYERRTHTLDAS